MANQRISGLHKNCKDITGQRFGQLIAKQATNQRKSRSVVWRCLCDCGNEVFVNTGCLCSGNTQSCGCSRGQIHITHGMSKTPIYQIWQDMIRRCENPNHQDYKYYGGRGISVCDRWHKFENFYADVSDPPKDMTLDRWPDNNGNYGPNNWKWSTRKEQAQNRRSKSYGPSQQRWFRAWHKDSMIQYLSNNQCEFARNHGLGNSNISACLHGKQKTHKGWTFC